MEIKELTPKSKEIIVQPKDGGVFCDVFSYEISGPAKNREGKKYFYMVSRVQSNDSSLGYVPNLIATFIKRELEAGTEDRQELFEKSLKKANELIAGLPKENEDLKLDFGVAFIDGEKVAVSKIGKAKMLCYRAKASEVFDVFENAAQAGKLRAGGKKFSNIVSGEIKKNDRFFFFAPGSGLNFKQKIISAALIKNAQDAFLENIRKIAAPPFNLSGLYFEIKEDLKKAAEENNLKKTEPELAVEKTPIIATEVAKISRSDTLKRTAGKFKEMIMGGDSNNLEGGKWKLIRPRGASDYLIAAFIAFVLVVGLVFLTKSNSKLKETLASVNEKLKVSESRLLLKQNYEARKFLNSAIAELNALQENEKKEKAFLAAMALLNRIEKIDPSVKPAPANDLTKYKDVDPSRLKNIFKNKEVIVSADVIKIINLDDGKTSELKKKFGFEPVEIKNYEDSLYFLGPKNIYKISNALLKPREELEWLKPNETDKISGRFVSFDLDSTIYALTDDKKLAVMFKGEVKKIIDLDFDVRSGTELVNLGGSGADKELLAIDKELKLGRVINDAGELKKSFDLSPAETIRDIFFDKDSRTLYLLSPAQIWEMKI